MAENPNEPPGDSNPMSAAELGESFRQTRREMIVMLGAWLTFFVWTGVCGALLSRFEPGEEVATLFGFPRWAFIGIVIPWLLANVFIFWFAGCFMKDTNLGPGSEESDA